MANGYPIRQHRPRVSSNSSESKKLKSNFLGKPALPLLVFLTSKSYNPFQKSWNNPRVISACNLSWSSMKSTFHTILIVTWLLYFTDVSFYASLFLSTFCVSLLRISITYLTSLQPCLCVTTTVCSLKAMSGNAILLLEILQGPPLHSRCDLDFVWGTSWFGPFLPF